MVKRILVALDGSELAESILPHAVDIAKPAGAELILLRVSDDPARDLMLADTMVVENKGSAQLVHFERRKYLDQWVEKLSGEGLKVSAQVVTGGAAETILAVAERTHADLIAMSTHGRGGLARLLMGSVAGEVVRNSRVPVLLVRPQAAPATSL